MPSSILANDFQTKFSSEGVLGPLPNSESDVVFEADEAVKQVVLCQLASAPGNIN